MALPAGDLGLGVTDGELVVAGIGAIGDPYEVDKSAIWIFVEIRKTRFVVVRVVRRRRFASGSYRT